ncbi:MAG: hypothetical protein NVS9B12_05350 [Vulcanimicrobiaceae bacterium]
MKFKDLARVAKSFKIEIGGFRAQGVPAVILALGGLTVAAGLVRVLNQNAAMLPETLREAKGLIESLRSGDPKRLNS